MSNNSFIEDLIKSKSDNNIAFFADFNSGLVLQHICSFLNSDGGWIIVGHDGKHKFGLNNVDLFLKLKELIFDKIFPEPLIYITVEHFGEKKIGLINVLKGSRQPYSLDGKFFITSKNKLQQASADDISILLRASNNHTSTWEKLTTIDADINSLDKSQIELTIKTANKLGRQKKLPSDLEAFLSYNQLLNHAAIKNGAIVLFGKEPTKFLPQCRIRISVLPYGKTGNRIDDTLLIEDNLFIAFDRLKTYFNNTLPVVSDLNSADWDRFTREKYPTDALDEAIVNAMVHRDYGDVAGEITINIYPNKIEIINSGEIPNDIIKGKNNIKPHHSILRNPTIAYMFFIRGKMEILGRGLSLIKNRFDELGLKSPEWTFQEGYTTLTLYSSKILLNKRMKDFLSQLSSNTSFTREEYQKFFSTSISERTARMDINSLLKTAHIEKINDGPQTKYSKTAKDVTD